ncbi:MAG: DUF4143 domain-containing protein, partial [Gallionella sp.]|nr:DUF4143 domain-containing protein [Gallionella sp.]
LFENFVISELLKRRYNQGLLSNLYFWRNNTGDEIDVVIEQGGRSWCRWKSSPARPSQAIFWRACTNGPASPAPPLCRLCWFMAVTRT